MTHGLTLGKYAPLHRGHQLVIETALAETDRVTVIIYDAPDATRIPLSVRANWIRTIYPQIRVIEAWDGPVEVGDTKDIKERHEDYVLRTLQLSGITHFYSSEFYGEHMSAALGAINRVVDPSRRRYPISGTLIRQDPFAFRKYIDPVVYRDLVANIVFLGAPCTGKTTIAKALAESHNTVWMPEYGREYWERHQINRRLTQHQLVEIAEEHIRREAELLYRANTYLFTDTNALTTYVFSLAYHGRADPRLAELAVSAQARYDLFFLCDTDIPYDDTWDRSGTVSRTSFQKRVIADLLTRRIPFFTLRGSLSARVAQVTAKLSGFSKYAPPCDGLGAGDAGSSRSFQR